jgi:hypothetical protein
LSQTNEVLRVKARIKALTEKTVANGCTEAEAMSAAEMVGRLLERYALSMDEIEIRSSRCVQREVSLGGDLTDLVRSLRADNIRAAVDARPLFLTA